MTQWLKYQNDDGSINLVSAYRDQAGSTLGDMEGALQFLCMVSSFQPISSRQAAATALAMAIHIAKGRAALGVTI